MAIGMGIKDLDVYGDSQLVINRLLEEFEVKKNEMNFNYLTSWRPSNWSMFIGVPIKSL